MTNTRFPMTALAAAFAGAALIAGSAAAQEEGEGNIEVGMLTCDLTQSSNMIVLSESEYLCELNANEDYSDGTYVATIDKIGIDLSSTSAETLKWGVITTSSEFAPKMMDGVYVGASADAALGKGAGVRVLVGGERDMFSLQPVSVSGSDGIGIAAGLERMELRRVEQ